jgi:hypothetical protein
MKKLFISLFIAVLTLPAVNAQFTKIGGGVAIGTGYHYNNSTETTYERILHRSPLIGIYLNGIYELKLPIHIAPSFTYFIPRHNQQMSTETRVSSMMIDIDGHYVFNALDRFEFFALAGFDIHFTSIKWLGTE